MRSENPKSENPVVVAPTLPPLWSHQREFLSRNVQRFALHFDPGTGKTRSILEAIRRNTYWINIAIEQSIHMVGRKILIFAPLNVCRNWELEIKHTLPDLPHRVLICAGQDKSKKLSILREFHDSDAWRCHEFLICNTETLRGEEYRKILAKCRADTIVVDEYHMLKTPTSQQTKGFYQIAQLLKPEYLYVLSGTPFPQGEMDMYTCLTLMGKNKESFFVWRKRHFEDKNERRRGMRNYWPDFRITEKSKALFQEWLSEVSLTAKKSEVLDLPPFLRTSIYAELSKEQKKHYETMEEYLFAIDAEGNELNASNLLSRTLRLQQITAGVMNDTLMSDVPRLQALEAAIEKTNGGGGSPEQFLIWTIFKPTYRQIAGLLEKLGISFAMLTGEQSASERAQSMEDFQSGKLRALICHPKAGGVGVNLTAASYSIVYTRSFSLTDDMQLEARNYRGGSERHKVITRIDIIAQDTIDEEIVEALKNKWEVQEFLLRLKGQHGRA